jgi:hypothetical protein
MTLTRFQKLLKQINPKLTLRIRSRGDIVGLFVGMSGKSGYLVRLCKGELQINGYKKMVEDDGMEFSVIAKRGRRTIANMLKEKGWIRNHKQMTALVYGVDMPTMFHDGFFREISGVRFIISKDV